MTAASVSGGVYDIGIGVPDLDDSIEYWRAFGYRPGERGQLTAAASSELYGVESALESVRLFHQSARQGLIRLMRWDPARGAGLDMAPLRTAGTRWSVHKTDDLLTAFTHAETLRRQGHPVALLGPVINPGLAKPLAEQRPFRGPVSCSYNLQIFQPLYQQVLMQRQNIDVGSYGTIATDSLLRCSEGCHVAVVVPGEREDVPDFYEQVLGLRRSGRLELEWNPQSVATIMFSLRPGETLVEVDLDDPTGPASPRSARPGRLRIFMLNTTEPLPDAIDRASPGQLGYSLYSYRSTDIAALRRRVAGSAATGLTPMLHDEFGRRTFCFRSPDRYFWQISEETG